MLTDYDSVENNNIELSLKTGTLFSEVNSSYAYYMSDLSLAQPRNGVNISLNYYDRNFFSKMLVLSSNSITSINNLVLMSALQSNINNSAVAKLPVDSYALNSENKFNFLTNVVADDVQLQDSSDIYIYSFYLILFDLELSRLFLFINNVLLSWLKNCLTYFKFFNQNALILIRNNLDFSVRLRTVLNKKGNNNMGSISSFHKVYLTNFVNNLTDDIDDIENNNYIAWFFYRNN